MKLTKQPKAKLLPVFRSRDELYKVLTKAKVETSRTKVPFNRKMDRFDRIKFFRSRILEKIKIPKKVLT